MFYTSVDCSGQIIQRLSVIFFSYFNVAFLYV